MCVGRGHAAPCGKSVDGLSVFGAIVRGRSIDSIAHAVPADDDPALPDALEAAATLDRHFSEHGELVHRGPDTGIS